MDIPDATDGTGHPIPLLAGETIANVQYIAMPRPTQPPRPLRELYRLAQVDLSEKIARFNPPLAGITLEGGADHASHLRLYEALFGRDSLRVAMDMLPIVPQLARTTLLELARWQGRHFDDTREEEPGRIPHEIRSQNDPVAQELTDTLGWQWPYYGSVDATPEFVRTLAAYCHHSREGYQFLFSSFLDKHGEQRLMADAFEEAVHWILDRLDSNKESLLESKKAHPHGIENQVWKDSWDAYMYHDGTVARSDYGIASIEVQRVAYDALIDAVEIYEGPLENPVYAQLIRERADALRASLFQHFWSEKRGGFFILGTHRDANDALHPLEVRASNMGHMLHSRLLEDGSPEQQQYIDSTVRHLFSPEMLAPAGIRTLASDEARYRPGAYHNGSVWLWDTHLIAKGLRKHGYYQLAHELGERLFAIVEQTQTFPEYVRGDSSEEIRMNDRIVDIFDEHYQKTFRLEQPPQLVQAWSVAAIIALKHYKSINHGTPAHGSSATEQSIIAELLQR